MNSRRALQPVRAGAAPAHVAAYADAPSRLAAAPAQDPAFDALVAALYGDVVVFEAAEEARIAADNAKHAAVCSLFVAYSL